MIVKSEAPSINDQDSPLRKKTNERVSAIAEFVHKSFPELTPNQITGIGAVIYLIGITLTEGQRRKTKINMTTVALGQLCKGIGAGMDALDGPVARILTRDGNTTHNPTIGAILDVTADRGEEFIAALARRDGGLPAAANALSLSVPGLARDLRRVSGHSVPEVGTNPVAFMGSRPGRVLVDIARDSTIYFGPKFSKRTTGVIDTVAAAANVYSVWNRLRTPSSGPISEKDRILARNRAGAYAAMELTALAIAKVVYRRRKKR